MDEDKKFETWLSNVCKRTLPANEMARVRTLARELADGVTKTFWGNNITAFPLGNIRFENIFSAQSPYSKTDFQSIIADLHGETRFIALYIYERWFGNYFPFQLLRVNHYIDNNGEFTKLAFDLIEEVESASIFISYKRSESSAFAMYLLTRLKMEGMEAFVDMALIPGEDWHEGLEKRIKEYDYFIVLIGKETLKSNVCIKEIGWAVEAGLTIIPVWHNEFKYNPSEWNIPGEIDKILGNTHSIQVKEESASGYNTAIVELLNVFGITP